MEIILYGRLKVQKNNIIIRKKSEFKVIVMQKRTAELECCQSKLNSDLEYFHTFV